MAFLMKIVLVGDFGVGKTSFLHHFCPKTLDQYYALTIGADFCLMDSMVRSRSLKYQIWGLTAQTKHDQVRSVYYYGSLGGIVMFDVTNPKSFANCEFWINSIFKHNGKGIIPIVIAGNKIDLRESEEASNFVYDEQAIEFCEEMSEKDSEFTFPIHYFPISVKQGTNLSEVLDFLGTTYLDQIES